MTLFPKLLGLDVRGHVDVPSSIEPSCRSVKHDERANALNADLGVERHAAWGSNDTRNYASASRGRAGCSRTATGGAGAVGGNEGVGESHRNAAPSARPKTNPSANMIIEDAQRALALASSHASQMSFCGFFMAGMVQFLNRT